MKIKNMIREYISRIIEKEPDKILEMIRSSSWKAVSFDVFDTLLSRNVPKPTDVFLLLEKHFCSKFGRTVPICCIRNNAEKKAVIKSGYKAVNLNEIYENMENLDKKEKQWLMSEELRLEHSVCQRNHTIGRIYDFCLSCGIPIILISDMYLPSEVIEQLLRNAGYSDWKRLYVSAQERKTKVDGSLFSTVLSDEKINSKDLLHIGDSLRGDYLVPRQYGISAVLVQKAEKKRSRYFNGKQFKKEKKQGTLSYPIIDSLVKNNIERYDGFYSRIGYAVIGPILYGYSKWVSEQIEKEQIKKVFFLAREGYFLQRGFNIYNNQSVQNSVIQVSRRATSGPRLKQAKNMSELMSLVTSDRAGFTVKKLLITCRIPDNFLEQLQEQEIFPDDELAALSDEKTEKLFYKIKPLINDISKEQERSLRGYLAQSDFYGPMAVCDVGWHGTIQASLQSIFPDEKISGYYIGRYDKGSSYPIDTAAFLFDNNANHEIFKCIMGTTDLFELFFMSDCGSASHYEQNKDGAYVCKMLPSEQDEDSMKCILKLQEAACDFVRDFKKLNDVLAVEIDPLSCSAAYRQFAEHMNNETIRELRRFSFLNVVRHSLVAEHDFGWYLLRPGCFINDFLNNGCKAPFLKSVFRVPLPYVQIVDLLRKFDRQ